MFRKLKSNLILVVFVLSILILFSNNVSAALIESVDSLGEVFVGENVTVNGKTITLTGNFGDNDIYEIGGDDYILDLNGYKFTAGEFYINDGSLTINDSRGNGEIDTEFDWLMVAEGAELVINNGKIDYLANEGKTIINDGIVGAITNYGTIVIEKGDFGPIWQRGNATIKGGTFTSNDMISAIDLDGKITSITGNVKFKNENGGTSLVINSGSAIGREAINQLIGKEYIFACSGYGTNIDSWNDEETGNTEYFYEVSYEEIEILKDETDTFFNKIAPNGVWTITGSKPKDIEEAEFLLTSIAGNIEVPDGYEVMAWVEPADEFDAEVVAIHIYYNGNVLKSKTVKAVYNEPSIEVKTKVNSVLDKIADKTGDRLDVDTGFRLEDLYLINYLNASTKGIDRSLALNFSKDLIALTNGGNISYKFDSRLGAFTPTRLWNFTGGQVIVYYDGVAVGTTRIGLTTNHVLYVPSDTLDDDDSKIEAALKRIKDYLGTTKGITISKGGTLESLNEDGYTWKDYGFIDENTCGTNYYNITINGETYKFAICKKDAKDLETPEYLASDIISNISIKSNSTKLPLDTAMSVESVTSNSIKKALGTEAYAAYDITLYSATMNKKITTLEDGKFVVTIPIPENLKNIKSGNLTVYYINEKGDKEEHVANVKDGMISFETDHFSTYVLSERVDGIDNPNTSDNILLAIETLILSITVIIVGIKCIKK